VELSVYLVTCCILSLLSRSPCTQDWTGLDWGFTALKQYLKSFRAAPEKWGRYSMTLACVTWFFYGLCLSSHPQELPPYILKPIIWRESEGYQWFKSLVVTGRGIEPTTYRSGSECSTSEPPGCGRVQKTTLIYKVQQILTYMLSW
jgi:hypothetical protein